MGRGRAKAKQTKVARELKYNSGGTDLNALRAELVHESGSVADVPDVKSDDVDELDEYASYLDDADDD